MKKHAQAEEAATGKNVRNNTVDETKPAASRRIKSESSSGGSGSGSGGKSKTIFQCEICGKIFGYKCNLELHGAVHSDEKNFVCGTCGRGFKLKVCCG